VSKRRTFAAIILFALSTTIASAAPGVPAGDDGGPSLLERVHRIVTFVVHALDDIKMSPPIP